MVLGRGTFKTAARYDGRVTDKCSKVQQKIFQNKDFSEETK